MELKPRRRMVRLNGQRVSVTLEPIFWELLEDSGLDTLEVVDALRGGVSLSSAARTYLTSQLVGQL